MKTLILTGSLATLMLFSACSGNDTPAYDSTLPSTNDTAIPAASTVATDTSTPVNVTTAAPVLNSNPVQVNPQPVSKPVVSAATAKSAAGTNPPHGQPGHRCDLAVGAPLNSAPAAAPTTSPVVSQVPAAVPAQAKPSVISGAKPAINPPHGEPGHDCAVQVGAPLPQ